MLQEISKILSSPINIVIIGWLGIYLFFVFFIFFYKFFTLISWINKEKEALNVLLMSENLSSNFLNQCVQKVSNINELTLNACIEAVKTKARGGIIFLSIVASTAPFIGLFGTVVGILNAFSSMKSVTTINMIAPAIADALIATAIGIIVAVPAYSFHQILEKKVEDLISLLEMQKDFYLSR